MRYIVALAVAAALICGAIYFVQVMGERERSWEEQNVTLSLPAMFALHVSDLIEKYSWGIFPLIAFASLAVAQALGPSKSHAEEN